jgi:hypothetical protein
MKPNVFIGRKKPSQLRAHNTKDVAQHRHQYHATIESKNKASTTGNPDGET